MHKPREGKVHTSHTGALPPLLHNCASPAWAHGVASITVFPLGTDRHRLTAMPAHCTTLAWPPAWGSHLHCGVPTPAKPVGDDAQSQQSQLLLYGEHTTVPSWTQSHTTHQTDSERHLQKSLFESSLGKL
jgi:hypothetical protein